VNFSTSAHPIWRYINWNLVRHAGRIKQFQREKIQVATQQCESEAQFEDKVFGEYSFQNEYITN
jgi:hypothetical protein